MGRAKARTAVMKIVDLLAAKAAVSQLSSSYQAIAVVYVGATFCKVESVESAVAWSKDTKRRSASQRQ
jgi:hypothetical protein